MRSTLIDHRVIDSGGLLSIIDILGDNRQVSSFSEKKIEKTQKTLGKRLESGEVEKKLKKTLKKMIKTQIKSPNEPTDGHF